MNIIDRNLRFTEPLQPLTAPDLLILHHEAAFSATVEQIHDFHIKSRGWSGIAYHLYVRKDGSVYRGRPIDRRGAHTSNYNFRSVGICCEGNFETEKMSDRQYDALCEAIAYVQSVYTGLRIIGHREVGATACPGKFFPLEEVKKTMQRYKTIDEVPAALRPETQQLIASGALSGKGGAAGLDVTEDMLRTLIIAKRYADKVAANG